MDRIIYAKMSDERDVRFQTMTKIAEKSGTKVVYKSWLYPEGKDHILNMKKSESRLSSIYKDRVHVSNAFILGDAVEFEYIEGKSLEEKISEICDHGDIEQLIKALEQYYQLIRVMKSDRPFIVQDEFIKIFGNVDLPETEEVGDLVNIDLIPSNILIKGEEVSIIDYEWVFGFPIPLEYVFFKGLFSLMHFAMMSEDRKEKVYLHFGLSKEKRKIYLCMEESFQQYVSGTTMTLRNYSEVVPFDTVSMAELEETEKLLKDERAVSKMLRNDNSLLRAEIDNIKNSKTWKILKFLGILKG